MCIKLFIIIATAKVWDILGRKVGKRKNLSEFDKGHIVMATRKGPM